jgi:hypothetical protein
MLRSLSHSARRLIGVEPPPIVPLVRLAGVIGTFRLCVAG